MFAFSPDMLPCTFVILLNALNSSCTKLRYEDSDDMFLFFF